MVIVSEKSKKVRYDNAVEWVTTQESPWKVGDLVYSKKLGYFVPTEFYSKTRVSINNAKVFELMQAQGWRGRIPFETSPASQASQASQASPTSPASQTAKQAPAQAPYRFEVYEHNPIIKFDMLMASIRTLLVENIQYIDKDEEILLLRLRIATLETQLESKSNPC